MNTMSITNAQYINDIQGNHTSITATIDGKKMFVPLDSDNIHYAEILKQVADGTLTIADAE